MINVLKKWLASDDNSNAKLKEIATIIDNNNDDPELSYAAHALNSAAYESTDNAICIARFAVQKIINKHQGQAR